MENSSANRDWTKARGRRSAAKARAEERMYGRTIRQKRRCSGAGKRLASLLSDAELLNDSLIPFGIRLSEVIEQATTPAHHHEKTAPGGMVLLMRLKMLRQFTNPCAQDRDLHFGRTGVGRVSAVLVNQSGFFLWG